MKKQRLLIVVLLVALVLSIVGCITEEVPPSSVIVNITATQKNVVIESDDAQNYDYTTLFVISEDGNLVPTLDSYIDCTHIVIGEQSVVTCTYKDKTATVNVLVYQPQYELNVEQDTVTVSCADALSFDYLSLFSAKKNNQPVSLDGCTVTSNVSDNYGTYAYTVELFGITKTLTVVVTNNVVITAKNAQVSVKDTAVETYDYTTLFSITKSGNNVNVKDYFLDLSDMSCENDFVVTCSYEDATASVTVHVILTQYEVALSVPSVTLYKDQIEGYNFAEYFKAYVDGKQVTVTKDMVTSNVTDTAGEYSFTVTCGKASKTLKVIVNGGHMVDVVVSYANLQLPVEQIDTYDYTSLFSLYVDGVAVQVTDSMIDATELKREHAVGKTYNVTFNYTTDDKLTTSEGVALVTPSQATDVTLKARNLDTYPNSKPIDLLSLFSVTDKFGADIPITSDMITGAIDYSTEGDNEITLTYNGQQAVAVVTVKKGVVILADDDINVKLGTDKATYLFENDITVIINGIKYWDIPDAYIDTSLVDFNKVGNYPVTVTIPYSTSTVNAMSKPKFVDYTKTVTYHVVENNYSVEVKNQLVTLPKKTTSYNLFNNLNVVINGKNQTLTDNPKYVDAISCYAQVLSKQIDFTSGETQNVTIAVYANGVNNDPVTVSYKLIVESDVVITAKDLVVVTQSTLYTTSLFTVVDDGEQVAVTNNMVEGKVDTFTAGIYYVTINYKNIFKQAKVVVLDKNIIGTYSTKLRTLVTSGYTDEEGYVESGTVSRTFGDLVIDKDFNITVNKTKATIISVEDANVIRIMLGSYEHTMYFDNGVVVLDPDNSIKLAYHDGKRPLVYFNNSVWNIDSKVTINKGSTYVLNATSATYSIDTFKLTSKQDGSTMWYALKVQLVEKYSSDTVYSVSWGQAYYPTDFQPAQGNSGKLTLNGIDYLFKMTSNDTATVSNQDDALKFANMNFTGTINGQRGTIKFNSSEGVTISFGGTTISLSSYEMNSMKNGGVDHYNNELFVYSYEGNNVDGKYYSYKFSLDTTDNTFTLLDKDELFGYYTYGNAYIYMDGYGTGMVNFNTTTTRVETKLVYNSRGNEVDVTFVDTSINFKYGTNATFYVSPLLNVLTGKYCADEFVEQQFVNQHIVDGAIITAKVSQVNKNATTSVPKGLVLDGITVLTANGLWTDEDKQNATNISFGKVKFSTAGCYSYTINVSVSGEKVAVDYPIMVVNNVYTGNPLAKNYISGAVATSSSIAIDEFGRATVNYRDTVFQGKATITDNAYVIKARSEVGTVIIKGEQLCDGVISAVATGAVNFSDNFTVGSVSSIATKGIVLRVISVEGTTLMYCSTSTTSLGTPATVQVVSGASMYDNGAILSITSESIGNVIAKVQSWGSVSDGLVLADNYRGTFTCEGTSDLTVDGFGNITIGNKTGKYTINSRYVLLAKFADETVAYKCNLTQHTYKVYDVALDETLLTGLTYQAEHTYKCGSSSFTATTTFVFEENGVVTVTSVSPSHDSDVLTKCEQGDSYNPTYASKKGTQGTFSVSYDVVTVSVGGETFTFTLTDIVSCVSIRCTETSVNANLHGYFETGTLFVLLQTD